jgi:heterodisulfide reductase subunit A
MTDEPSARERKIGVVVCQCGGNISDYVDVEKVRATLEKEKGVASAQIEMFACSEAGQQDAIRVIREKKLNGIVVCSCSPKLHTSTFRAMAERAGLNPYQYTQVNIREQDSWAHTHDRAGATEKAIQLVRGGVAKTALSEPLERMRVETLPQAVVIGAGVAGLRASLALSDLGISVHLVEKAPAAGGQVARWGDLFPNDKVGRELVDQVLLSVGSRDNITTYLSSEVVEKTGRLGAFDVTVRTGTGDTIALRVGAIVVATGFEPYTPPAGEFGYGLDGVVTLPEFKELLADRPDRLTYHGRDVRSIVYVYCVGSRDASGGSSRTYCSRYCCTATSHIATVVNGLDRSVHQFHLFRDVRTYGRYEAIYEKALRAGSVFLRYSEEDPPTVSDEHGTLVVRVRDRLMGGEEVEVRPDLVVLVTGMVPRASPTLVQALKLPVGSDGFFREVHVKLRPVETVVDGVFIVGAAQGPKNVAESVASALAGVSKTAALLLKGYVNLDPLVARVDPSLCTWCDECTKACPYGAVEKVAYGEKEVAEVNAVLCKGEGACVPVCPKQAVSVLGYTNEQITSMIDAMAREVVA